VNLEAPFSDRGKPVESGMIFKAEPEMIGALKLAGIDIVSTANNHARDCNGYGVEFTLDWLARHGIATVGSAKSAEAAHAGTILTRNDTRFGFLAYTYDQSNGNHKDVDDRIAAVDVEQMQQDVADLRTRADVAIVSMHAGYRVRAPPQPAASRVCACGDRSGRERGRRASSPRRAAVGANWRGRGVLFARQPGVRSVSARGTQHGVLARVKFSGAKLVEAETVPVDIVRTVPRLAEANRQHLIAAAEEGTGSR